MMSSITTLHRKFVHQLAESSKLFPSNPYSVLPSVLFLVSVFALLYIQFHKHNTFIRWKTKVFKSIIFHWTYFYTSRIWFMFIKLCRWIMQYSDKAIEKTSIPEEIYYNKLVTHLCIFVLVFSVSIIPCLILYVRYLNMREIPNFLMWVAEDPWVRSEIGTSGHYLERPPREEIYIPNKHNASYRSGRSSSVDTNVYLQKPSGLLRPCKSAISMKTSAEEIVGQ